jgi:hypothetical protein
VTAGTIADGSNIVGVDPLVVSEYEVTVQVLPWRGNPNFVDPLIVAVDQPVELMGDYHLQGGSPAIDAGAGAGAPGLDIDDDGRPQGPAVDIGADEVLVAQAAFPTAAILDSFDRADGSLGGNWNGNTQTSRFRILSGEVQVLGVGGSIWWNPDTFGADQEAFFTLNKVTPDALEQALLLKLNGNPNNNNSWLVEVSYHAATGTIQVWSKSPANGWVLHGALAQPLAGGEVLGARVQTNGTVSVFVNGTLIGSANLRSGPTPWAEAYIAGGGQLGTRFTGGASGFAAPSDARFDDFGGGSMP